MSDGLRIAVAGCAGRMGRALLSLIDEHPGFILAGGLEHQGSPFQGKPLTDLVPVTDKTLQVRGNIENVVSDLDVLIDFSTPFATVEHLAALVDTNCAAVIGTTGFKAEQEKEIEAAAKQIPIVKSGNMSLGVNLLTELVKRAAASLGDDFDIEVHEAHHRYKVDAPSGTALMLGDAAAEGRGVDLDAKAVRTRDGIMPEREAGVIGFSVKRAGGIIGEHEVLFGSDDELLTLSHKALDRSLFARGAITAASWVKGRAPGLYSMRDVLGLTTS